VCFSRSSSGLSQGGAVGRWRLYDLAGTLEPILSDTVPVAVPVLVEGLLVVCFSRSSSGLSQGGAVGRWRFRGNTTGCTTGTAPALPELPPFLTLSTAC
jgi:hypothetical protein